MNTRPIPSLSYYQGKVMIKYDSWNVQRLTGSQDIHSVGTIGQHVIMMTFGCVTITTFGCVTMTTLDVTMTFECVTMTTFGCATTFGCHHDNVGCVTMTMLDVSP